MRSKNLQNVSFFLLGAGITGNYIQVCNFVAPHHLDMFPFFISYKKRGRVMTSIFSLDSVIVER